MTNIERLLTTFEYMIRDINTYHSGDDGSLEYKEFQMIKQGLQGIIEDIETIEDIEKRVIHDNKLEPWRQPS